MIKFIPPHLRKQNQKIRIVGYFNKLNKENVQYIYEEMVINNIFEDEKTFIRQLLESQYYSVYMTNVFVNFIQIIHENNKQFSKTIIQSIIRQLKLKEEGDLSLKKNDLIFIKELTIQGILSDLFGLEFIMNMLGKNKFKEVLFFIKNTIKYYNSINKEGLDSVLEIINKKLMNNKQYQNKVKEILDLRKQQHPNYKINKNSHFISYNEDFKIIYQKQIFQIKEKKIEQKIDKREIDLQQLRERVYMRVMNSVDYREAAHKVIKLKGSKEIISDMIVDLCIQQKSFQKFYGLLCCQLTYSNQIYKKYFFQIFIERYSEIYDYEVLKIRKMANLFAFLLYRDGLDWEVFSIIDLSEEMTTSSSRIFVKILFQQLVDYFGIDKLYDLMRDPNYSECFDGILNKEKEEKDFVINFFKYSGLKKLVIDLIQLFYKLMILQFCL